MNVYLEAAIISLILIFASLIAIKGLDDYRINSIRDQLDQLQTDIEDSKLFLLYSQSLGDNSTLICQALQTQISARIDKNQQLVLDLQKYESVNVFSDEYFSLKNIFISKNLELWMYLYNYKRQCNSDQVSILYFYPDRKACAECEVQANILTDVRNKCPNIKIFALPINADMGVLNIIRDRFNITKTPTIVINENTVMEGITTEDSLLSIVKCQKSSNSINSTL
jgi:hypothetical protein